MMKGRGWEEGEKRTLRLGGRRCVACARHACASFWLLGKSFPHSLTATLHREDKDR